MAARVLKVEGELLRSDDRFDELLAPVPGYPSEDEVDELSDIVRESGEERGETIGSFVNQDFW